LRLPGREKFAALRAFLVIHNRNGDMLDIPKKLAYNIHMTDKEKKTQILPAKTGKDIFLETIREGYELPDVYFDAKINKATDKKNIVSVLNLEQLTGKRLKDFYVDTDTVRGGNALSSLKQLLDDPLNPYIKLLFSGFLGSGKTTELIKLSFQLQEKYNVIIFSVMSRLKIDQVTIESLLFEIIEDTMQFLNSNNLVDESDGALIRIVENITDWCSETRIIKETEEKRSKSVTKGIEFLKGIFFSAKKEKRSGNVDKTQSTLIEEHKINDLILECNKIFDYLRRKTGKETIIIVDDLEKMSFTKSHDFYIPNASFIKDFHCKMVLTIPVELVYSPDFANIQNVFGEAEVLPMIKIKDQDGETFQPGIDKMTEILERRLDLMLFENQCYKKAIEYSGGALRELFRIIQRAAMIENSEIITEDSMKKSISYHKNIFASRIQENRGEIHIKFDEYLEILIDIYDGNRISPKKNLALLDLLRTRAIMKYNGEGFFDTHPLLDNFIQSYKKQILKNGNQKPG